MCETDIHQAGHCGGLSVERLRLVRHRFQRQRQRPCSTRTHNGRKRSSGSRQRGTGRCGQHFVYPRSSRSRTQNARSPCSDGRKWRNG